MRTGLMRRQIILRSTTKTPDGGGGYTETPVDIGPIWARIQPLQGTEQLRAMQTGMQRPHQIVIRYREGVTGDETVIYDDRTFDIKSIVDPEEKHRELILMADEVIT